MASIRDRMIKKLQRKLARTVAQTERERLLRDLRRLENNK